MIKHNNVSNIEKFERRKHWQDRRTTDDRRNLSRLHLANFECRGATPRRSSDRGGVLSEGEIWWNTGTARYE